jgi:hypothetical protein
MKRCCKRIAKRGGDIVEYPEVDFRGPGARKRERCAGRRSRPASSRDERLANPEQRGRASRLAQPRSLRSRGGWRNLTLTTKRRGGAPDFMSLAACHRRPGPARVVSSLECPFRDANRAGIFTQ